MTKSDIRKKIGSASSAALKMAALSSSEKEQALSRFADLLWDERHTLLRANRRDCAKTAEKSLSPSMLARLKLDESKLLILCDGIRELARANDPVHRVMDRMELDDGLILEKRTVPIGVIAVIFESRPDVIPQILSLILKSGNVALLKGGHEAQFTNLAFMKIVATLTRELRFLPKCWAQLFLERQDIDKILKFEKDVSLVIPRGSNALVQSIQRRTKIPVLGHADGVCHLYWDESADFAVARAVIIDAKTQYPAVCNAIETLLVHHSQVEKLGELLRELVHTGVKIFGDVGVRKAAGRVAVPTPGRVRDWHTEYGDLRLSVRLVKSIDEAIAHINKFGSHHTDGILTRDPKAQAAFLAGVDSATLTVNASTRFADGYRFGMGAEVGISTNKIHARGPVGVDGLITYQYILLGDGHVVSRYVATGDREPERRFTHRRVPPK